MTPRPVRRGSRLPTVESDIRSSSPTPLPVLQKPNLPKLVGTPASRRQYTYGSGVEPPPARPDRVGRHNQPLDLGNAVGNVLSRQEREDEVSATKQMPPPPRPGDDALDTDELAGDGRTSQAEPRATGEYRRSCRN